MIFTLKIKILTFSHLAAFNIFITFNIPGIFTLHKRFFRLGSSLKLLQNEERRKDLPTGQFPLTIAFVKLQPELCEAFAKVVGFNPNSLYAKSPRVPSFRSFPSSRTQAHLHLELT